MKKFLLFTLAAIGAYFSYEQSFVGEQQPDIGTGPRISQPAEQWKSGQQVSGYPVV